MLLLLCVCVLWVALFRAIKQKVLSSSPLFPFLCLCLRYFTVSFTHPSSCPAFSVSVRPWLCVCVLFVHERLCACLLCVFSLSSLLSHSHSLSPYELQGYMDGVRGRVYASLMPSVHLTPHGRARESDNLFSVLRSLFFRIIPNIMPASMGHGCFFMFLFLFCVYFFRWSHFAFFRWFHCVCTMQFLKYSESYSLIKQNRFGVVVVGAVAIIANAWVYICCRGVHSCLYLNETDWDVDCNNNNNRTIKR